MIRLWNEGDIGIIERIEKECFDVPWTLNMLISEYANPLYKCLVYEQDGKILGYIGFFIISGQIDIGNVAVRPGCRRQGVAKKLVASLIDFSVREEIKDISLEVRLSNVPAIKLYENFGFKKEGLRKKYYEGMEDALIMWRRR